MRKMTLRMALELWKMKLGNCEATPQAIWPIVKSLIKCDEPEAPTAVHGPLGLKYQAAGKATTIADCLENQLTPHNLGDENHKQRVEARVQALLKAADNTTLEKVRPCDV
jgi:hypothetical protein